MAASNRYRFFTMTTTCEERPYLSAAIRHYYPGTTKSAFLRKCLEAEFARLAAEKQMTVQDLLAAAMAAENPKGESEPMAAVA